MPVKKFRPYFTEPEMLEIIQALKSSPTPTRLGLIRYLQTFLRKIEDGTINPSHVQLPSLSERLGFDNNQTSETLGESAYQKQLINPKSCTPKEIEAAMAWRYEHDLMSPDEERSYESTILKI